MIWPDGSWAFSRLLGDAGTRNLASVLLVLAAIGFVIGGILFADYGLIAREDQKLLSGRVYQAYGCGLRTQNQSISRTNFELALVYNPYNPPSGKGNTEISFSAAFVLGIREFNFNEPEIIKLNND